MAVGVEHPVVAEYLRRLDAASAALPAGRREELAAEIRGHVVEALVEAGRDDEATVRGVLDRLGDPEDIVAVEVEADPGGPGGTARTPPPVWAPAASYTGQARGVWGPVEIIAVLGLTVGTVLLPVLGPVIGLVCAWLSDRWTRREKIVATIWTTLAAALLLLLGIAGLVAGGTATRSDSPTPAVSLQGVPVAPGESSASAPAGTATP